MTKNSRIRNYGKVCTISGKSFPGNVDHFYVNNNAPDGLHLIIKALTTSEEQLEQV